MSDFKLDFDTLGVQVVKFTFESAQGQEIRIHKALLEQSSQLIHQMFRRPSQDHLHFLSRELFCTIKANPSQTEWGYHLPPRFDYKVLQILVEFMYNRDLKDVREYSGTIRKVFQLASELEVPSYMGRVLAEFRNHHQNITGGFAMNEVEDIYNDKFRADGGLWQYCLENVAGRMARGDVSFSVNDWIVFAKKHPGVAQDFMEHQLLTSRNRIVQVAADVGKTHEDTATATSDESTVTSIEGNMDVDKEDMTQIEKSEKTKELAVECKQSTTGKKKTKQARAMKNAQHKHRNRKQKITVPNVPGKQGKKRLRKAKQNPLVSVHLDHSMIRSMEGAGLETSQQTWREEAGDGKSGGSLGQGRLEGRGQREASMVFKTEPGGGRSVLKIPTGPRFAWQV